MPRFDPDEWYDEATLGRRCPSCPAKPGDLCTRSSGLPRKPHPARTRTIAQQRAKRKASPNDPTPAQRQAVARRSGGWCETCPLLDPRAPRHPAEDIHHKAGRVGEHANDVDNLLHSCRRMHRLLHDDADVKRRAYECGALVRRTTS